MLEWPPLSRIFHETLFPTCPTGSSQRRPCTWACPWSPATAASKLQESKQSGSNATAGKCARCVEEGERFHRARSPRVGPGFRAEGKLEAVISVDMEGGHIFVERLPVPRVQTPSAGCTSFERGILTH